MQRISCKNFRARGSRFMKLCRLTCC